MWDAFCMWLLSCVLQRWLKWDFQDVISCALKMNVTHNKAFITRHLYVKIWRYFLDSNIYLYLCSTISLFKVELLIDDDHVDVDIHISDIFKEGRAYIQPSKWSQISQFYIQATIQNIHYLKF